MREVGHGRLIVVMDEVISNENLNLFYLGDLFRSKKQL